jgi:hypothetical protein
MAAEVTAGWWACCKSLSNSSERTDKAKNTAWTEERPQPDQLCDVAAKTFKELSMRAIGHIAKPRPIVGHMTFAPPPSTSERSRSDPPVQGDRELWVTLGSN